MLNSPRTRATRFVSDARNYSTNASNYSTNARNYSTNARNYSTNARTKCFAPEWIKQNLSTFSQPL